MESQTLAEQMPDVKGTPCDLSASAPPAGCSMDLERRVTELPAPLSVLAGPLTVYPGPDTTAYASLQAPPGRCPIMPAYPNSTLLTSLGLRCCSTSSVHPLKHGDAQPAPPHGCPPQVCVKAGGGRLYRSMENLHWAAVSDPGIYAFSAPYGSVDSEFIFQCAPTSHWYEAPETLAFCPSRAPSRKDVPLFPQWLLPAVDEQVLNGNARRGLKEKLRLQSSRVTEPNKPLRPQVTPEELAAQRDWAPWRERDEPGLRPRPTSSRRITSPEEIKQEALRRLQLRRQNSTPDLTLRSSEEPSEVAKSKTAESLTPQTPGGASSLERRRPPVGRLHIPTFEEFKKMRRGESGQEGPKQGQHPAEAGGQTNGGTFGNLRGEESDSEVRARTGQNGGGQASPWGQQEASVERTSADSGQTFGATESPEWHRDSKREGPQPCQNGIADRAAVPICTSPTPRPPLPALSTHQQTEAGRNTANIKEDMSAPTFPHARESSEAPPSCCPALLLDGTDLSSYGAKISKMKDGFLGSALDLIKKSCSAEITAEAPVRLSRDQDGADITAPQPARQSSAVSMTMPACSTEDHNKPAAGGGEPAECQQPSPGCRRSSSDAAYEPADSAKTQRECRLRPHFSDPMPADAAKRKQIEMKIAAVARLHGQRRDRDKDRDSMSDSVRERSETGGGETLSLAVTRGTQHRWSNVSSLSADSGVVGLSDEREEEDEPRQPRRNADVERVDSGIGPGLARGWKRPSASLRARELQRPCPDCGQRDAGRSGDRMCDRCQKQRTERKEAILEFLNTESSYGEDLRIIKEEFLCPMQSAGLLTAEQLAIVFSNVQELIDVNDKFTEHLQDCIDQAFDQGDEDLLTVCIGEIFLEFVNMLPAFQTYCLQQSTAVNMLNTLEKEKELLRIFLDVSQNDNTALRRMNLRSFLMAPLQRVTKYPLLLSRISKATAECHPDHARLREAKSRVESHLEHINTRTKQEGATWSLRSFRRDSRKSREVVNIEMREMSMRTVGWARESTRFVMEGPLQISQPADGQWVKKGSRALKFQNVQSLLMVHVHRASEGPLEGCGPTGPTESSPELVRDGVLVLIKDKSSGKFAVLREPIRLGNCVVSADPECDDTFELLDIRREAFVLRAADKSRTQQWFRQIKRYSRDLGPWRKRRNALPNIMINTTQNRS
ncbi:hypothetical protein AGOR_G00215130 [Albula goreensis]|uniref:DH domain-containing protein n=1 Tax=Albula goreensis TaxID=1534307 RepID=A0A8T3CKG9_9TELE|nr:hypothetical protein AGOR_G00215130 [Albula goreensis]